MSSVSHDAWIRDVTVMVIGWLGVLVVAAILLVLFGDSLLTIL